MSITATAPNYGRKPNIQSLSPARPSHLFAGDRGNKVTGKWGSINLNNPNFSARMSYIANPGQGAPAPRIGGSFSSVTGVNVSNPAAGAYMWTATGLQAAGTIAQLFGGSKTEKPQGAVAQLDQQVNSLSNTNGANGVMTNQLSGASSFHEINSIQENIEQKKANLNAGYQNIATTSKSNIDSAMSAEGVKEGLQLAKVNIDTNKISLSELDSNDLAKSIETIKSDISNVENFMESLGSAKQNISAESGKVKGEISAKKQSLEQLKANNKDGENNAQIQELENAIQELEKQEKQLEAAKTAVDQVNTECNSMIDSLRTKESNIKDIKQTEDNMKDKKYDLAKSQDQELKKSMDKLDKLNKEIESLKSKKDDKNEQKIASLIQQRTGEYSNLSKLVTSLSGAGEKSFTNSKGTTYKLQFLDKASNMASSQPTELTVNTDKKPDTES